MKKEDEEFLSKIQYLKNNENKLKILKDDNIPIILWGAGSLAKSVKKYLEKNNLEVKAVLIDTQNKNETYFEGIIIHSIEELEKSFEKVNIVIGHSKYNLRYDLLNKSKAIKNIYYFCNICYEQYQPISYSLIKENVSLYSAAYNKLKDIKSKECMIAYLNARINDDIAYIEKCYESDKNSYFDNELFKIDDYETYLDLGAYVGDTIDEFLKISNLKYNKIIAFEPDENNFNRLETYIIKNKVKNVIRYQLGCYDKKTKLYFKNKEESSGITEEGEESINVIDLDSIIYSERVSVIKINYLYGVLETLNGAKRLFVKNKPKAAISVGFDELTLVKVINFFEEINQCMEESKYNIKLRYNAAMPSRLVLYASI